MKKLIFSVLLSIVALTATADEYIDPVTNVIYTYEPGQTTASVKAGYEYAIGTGVVQCPGSPDATGNVMIRDRFTVGTDEYVVTSIDEKAFWVNYNIESIVIPETVTEIGMFAFAYCINLMSVVLPSSVTIIDQYAFANCSKLDNLNLPESVKFVGRSAFDFTPWYTTIYNEAPDGLFYIGSQLFGYKGDKPTGELVIREGTTCVCRDAFSGCRGLTSITIPKSVAYVDYYAFDYCTSLKAIYITDLAAWCGIEFFGGSNPLKKAHHLYLNGEEVTNLVIPEGVTSIGSYAFENCTALTSLTIPDGVTSIGMYAFRGCSGLANIISHIEEPFEIEDNVFESNKEGIDLFTSATLFVPKGCKSRYESTPGWNSFSKIIEDAYRPFIEDGKVWKVGNTTGISDGIVKRVEYYYFDGDTIIGGKTCKQMMCQRYVGPDYSNEYLTPTPSLSKVGAWYEENQKVYFYDERKQAMVLKYDFSLNANDTLQFLTDWSSPFIIGPKQTGGIEGFKGVYRDIRMCGDEDQSFHDTFWLEGVGCIRGPISNPCNPILADPKPEFLMSCAVGDEVIYLNNDYLDGATPEELEARTNRFDFTHTVKTQPKAPRREGREEEESLYGEYNNLRLGINLDLLDDAYLVSIADESGQVVYMKTVNAGCIVALDIDISAYAKGHYTVTVENSSESFTGEFEMQTTGIATMTNNKSGLKHNIYNLQGQRLSTLRKGLNILDGQKVFVK